MSQIEVGPGTQTGGTTHIAAATAAQAKDTAYRSEDGFQAPPAEDRADARFRAEASARGYKLATKCLDCGHYVVNEVSVRAHRGPVCRRRHAEAVAE